jgi:hypothetical protein
MQVVSEQVELSGENAAGAHAHILAMYLPGGAQPGIKQAPSSTGGGS